MTTASAVTFTYDVATVALVEVPQLDAAPASTERLDDVREGSISPSTGAPGTSTTPFQSFVATNTVDANVVMGRKGASQTFVDDAGRSTTVKYGGEIQVAPGTNIPGVVNGRAYSGHALDQMQARGIMPSVVDDAIATGASAPSRGGTSVFYGAGKDVSVVVNSQGKVVTVSYGDLRS